MSVDHRSVQCCYENCSALIWMTPAEEERRRKTHEWWYCPEGHQQHFSDKTEQEKEIERLTRRAAYLDDHARWLNERLADERRTCPWSGCEYIAATPTGRHMHMVRAHGMPTLAAVREEAAS